MADRAAGPAPTGPRGAARPHRHRLVPAARRAFAPPAGAAGRSGSGARGRRPAGPADLPPVRSSAIRAERRADAGVAGRRRPRGLADGLMPARAGESLRVASPEEMRAFGARLAGLARPGDLLVLA